eukprot:3590590-Lingulodinium_polyedra.AAC.1
MLDHHGVTSHVVANIFWAHLSGERESDALPGANLQERLDFLNADIRAYYQARNVSNRLPPLKESNIKPSTNCPELKGNA